MAKQISLKLPDELHERLKAASEHDRRSLHAETLWALEDWLNRREADGSE